MGYAGRCFGKEFLSPDCYSWNLFWIGVCIVILTIDLGTTNLKVGIFRENGSLTMVSTEQTPYVHHPDGYTYIPAHGLWKQVQGLMQKTMESSGNPNIRAVSITSMAESGL